VHPGVIPVAQISILAPPAHTLLLFASWFCDVEDELEMPLCAEQHFKRFNRHNENRLFCASHFYRKELIEIFSPHQWKM
jgi:hypothetical protein